MAMTICTTHANHVDAILVILTEKHLLRAASVVSRSKYHTHSKHYFVVKIPDFSRASNNSEKNLHFVTNAICLSQPISYDTCSCSWVKLWTAAR